MKGAAFRGAALAIGFAVSATVALAEASSDVTDNDRMWANFTREAAVVGERRFWVELRGIKLYNGDPAIGLNGYPVESLERRQGEEVTDIEGGRFDLIGAYGIQSWEVGLDLPFVMQQQIDFDDGTFENDANVGDLLLYGKYKMELAEHWAGGLGLEMSIPTGPEDELLGSGDLGFNPFLSTRYQSGPVGLGGHLGFLLNTGSQASVFNWSVQGVVRASQHFSLRAEVIGRLFKDYGSTFNDVAVYPGLDVNLFENVIIRPEGLAGLSGNAFNWGIGLGLVFTM
jgi:hypothetical protein